MQGDTESKVSIGLPVLTLRFRDFSLSKGPYKHKLKVKQFLNLPVKHLLECFAKSARDGQGKGKLRGNQECGSALRNPACSGNFHFVVTYLQLCQAYLFHKIQKIKDTKCILIFHKAYPNFALSHFIEMQGTKTNSFVCFIPLSEKMTYKK